MRKLASGVLGLVAGFLFLSSCDEDGPCDSGCRLCSMCGSRFEFCDDNDTYQEGDGCDNPSTPSLEWALERCRCIAAADDWVTCRVVGDQVLMVKDPAICGDTPRR